MAFHFSLSGTFLIIVKISLNGHETDVERRSAFLYSRPEAGGANLPRVNGRGAASARTGKGQLFA
jgi:hypothetical protein